MSDLLRKCRERLLLHTDGNPPPATRALLDEIDAALAGVKVKWRETQWGAQALLDDGRRLEVHGLRSGRWCWEAWSEAAPVYGSRRLLGSGQVATLEEAKLAAERASGVK